MILNNNNFTELQIQQCDFSNDFNIDILDILLTHSGTRKDPVAQVNEKYTNFDYPDGLEPFFLYKVSDKKGTRKMSYIKLAAFLKILDNALFPTGNKGEKLVSFAYDLKEDRFNFATFENHFSFLLLKLQ